ncbi:DUF2087 domain-containing protein [Micrococcus terreus]|uniref:DUF2087 domain-containing protein n=1 Tax=Micrococcus terreus TaxID=574650 RepID=UPI0023F6EB67|nr:DUF2087 domain-containing protein [Micrococcus terreus]
MSTPTWKPILAALGNEAARTVFARATLGQLDGPARAALTSRESKALRTWLNLGVLFEPAGPDDDATAAPATVTVDGALLRATLTTPAERDEQKARAGVGRFLVDGLGPRIHTLPATPNDRLELLRWVRDAVLTPGEVVSEPQLNQRLSVFHADVALLRRYLVDHELLERTPMGTEYAIPDDETPVSETPAG